MTHQQARKEHNIVQQILERELRQIQLQIFLQRREFSNKQLEENELRRAINCQHSRGTPKVEKNIMKPAEI